MTIVISDKSDSGRLVRALLVVRPSEAFWKEALAIDRTSWRDWRDSKLRVSRKNLAKVEATLKDLELFDKVLDSFNALEGTKGSSPSPSLPLGGESGKSAEHPVAQDESKSAPLEAALEVRAGGLSDLIEEEGVPGDLGSDDEPPMAARANSLEWPRRWLRSHRQELFLPVHKFVWLYPPEKEIIACPAFQRLRLLSQLGMSYVSFPGATHKRFEHVLGTVSVTDKIIRAVNHNCEKEDQLKNETWILEKRKLTVQETMFVRLAALLHDIGHLPYGHTIEDELNLISDKHDEPERLDNIFGRTEWFGMDKSVLVEAERKAQTTLGQTIDQYYDDLIDLEVWSQWKDQFGQSDDLGDSIVLVYQQHSFTLPYSDKLLIDVLNNTTNGLSTAKLRALHKDLASVLQVDGGGELPSAVRRELTGLLAKALSGRFSETQSSWKDVRRFSIEFPAESNQAAEFEVEFSAQTFVQMIILKRTSLPLALKVRRKGEGVFSSWKAFQASDPLVATKSAKREFAEVLQNAIEDSGFRLGVCRDIVGNTICADLLDYLHRDWYHTGRVREFDERIFQYMEMRKGAEEPYARKSTQIVVAIDSNAGLRLDGVSAILDLLESRYQLAETVLFHKTKLRATAMLERALMLAYQALDSSDDVSASEALLEFLLANPEDALLHSMVEGKVFGTAPGGNDEMAHPPYLQTAKRIAYALMSRRYYKDLVIKYDGHLQGTYTREHALRDYAKDYEIAEGQIERASLRRQATLELLEHDFRLPLGTLAFYCPADKMNAKVAEVKVLAKKVVRPFHEHKDGILNELSGGHLDAQKRRFQSLWRIVFYYDALVLGHEIDRAIRAHKPEIGVEVNGKPVNIAFESATPEQLLLFISEQTEKYVKLLKRAVSTAALNMPDEGLTPNEAYVKILKERDKEFSWVRELAHVKDVSNWPNVQSWLKVAARTTPLSAQLRDCPFPSGVTRRG